MPRVGFEPTIPVFERAKTVHSLDRAATVIRMEFGYWTLFTYPARQPALRIGHWPRLKSEKYR
jgi:hypothetical protein